MTRMLCQWATVAGLTMALCACGDSEGTNFIPAPPATPAPAPTPTPTPSPTPTPTPTPAATTSPIAVFPDLNKDAEFATVGYNVDSVGALSSVGFAARYDAASQTYLMTVPSSDKPGVLEQYEANTPNSRWWGGVLNAPGANTYTAIGVLKPDNPDLKLSFTSLVEYASSAAWFDGAGVVAFGTATPVSAVPNTGTATYNALVVGEAGQGSIRGDATLSFDFGAGKLSGHFDPTYSDYGGIGDGVSLGRYDFVNTVFSSGSTSFSGELSNSSFTSTGSFAGLFTGPNAEELMSRWTAPYKLPGDDAVGTMFGVWVGAK